MELLKRVTQAINPQYQLLRMWQLAGGSSAQMTAFEVLLPDGKTRKLILRQRRETVLRENPQAVVHEYRLLKDLHSAGLSVSAPIFLDQSGEIFSAPYLVLEFVEGNAEYAPANIDSYIRQFAAQLIKIHRLNGSTSNFSYLPGQIGLANKFREAPANIDPAIDASRIVQVLKQATSYAQGNASSLLHGDYWPGNVLWKEGQLIAVIDWEDAQIGDPLSDFAISRLDMLMIFGQQALQEFTQQYQSQMPLDYTNLPYWDLCSVLRVAPYLSDYGPGYAQLGRPDITAQTMQASLEWFVAQALEALFP